MRHALVFVLVSAAFALVATTASAEAPSHHTFSQSGEFRAPAGTVCDFDLSDTFTIEVNVLVWGDPGNETRVNEHLTAFVTHTNLDTGYVLTEVDHYTQQFNAETERFKIVGLLWHLHDPTGKLVVVQAGQLLFDTTTGELLRATPNLDPDAAAIICPALGGSPA